ncbi:hypothetical protein Unana1_04701 [Umbelopsis nana]
MQIYPWDVVQSTLIAQAIAAQSPIYTLFFEKEHFFAPKGVGTSFSFFEGTDEHDQAHLLVSRSDAEKLAEFLSLEHLGAKGRLSLAGLAGQTFHDIKPCKIQSAQHFSKAVQRIKKKNKSKQRLKDAIDNWKGAIDLVKAKRHVFVSFDIEVYELDHKILLELGWSMYDSRSDKFMDQHYINNTYRHLSNGRFVDDQKLKFMFGVSVWASTDQALNEFRKDLEWCVRRDGGFILVGHGLESDIKFLAMQKFQWPTAANGGKGSTTDINGSAFIATLDTETIYGAYCNDMHDPPSLGRTLDNLNLDSWCLHNAGKL